jgi:hypothetical protein
VLSSFIINSIPKSSPNAALCISSIAWPLACTRPVISMYCVGHCVRGTVKIVMRAPSEPSSTAMPEHQINPEIQQATQYDSIIIIIIIVPPVRPSGACTTLPTNRTTWLTCAARRAPLTRGVTPTDCEAINTKERSCVVRTRWLWLCWTREGKQ